MSSSPRPEEKDRSLRWLIADSRLPPNLKATLNAMALWANPTKGYGNIYASKKTLGDKSGRGERAIRRDCDDLVALGVLNELAAPPPGVTLDYIDRRGQRVTFTPGPGKPKLYQVWIEGILKWGDEQNAQYAARRRATQSKQHRPLKALRAENRQLEIVIETVRETLPGIIDENDRLRVENARLRQELDPGRTRQGLEGERGADDPGRTRPLTPAVHDTPPPVVHDSQSFDLDLRTEGTVSARGQRPVNAVENSAAPLADSPGSGARPPMHTSANPFHAVKPGETRHRIQAHPNVYYATSQNTQEKLSSTSSAAFHILSEIGRKLLAGYGLGEIHWAEVRSDLRNRANNLGIDLSHHVDLIQRVEDSLVVQHRHFQTSKRADPATPPEKTAVRPSYEAET